MRRWLSAKGPILRFVVILVVVLVAFLSISMTQAFETRALIPYSRLNAQICGGILRFFGEQVRVAGATIFPPSLEIGRGCEGTSPLVLFLAAVVALPPASWRAKLLGLAAGLLLVASLNVIRIITLFYVRKYYPNWFETMHMGVWQVAFITCTLLLWVMWAWWATRPQRGRGHVDDGDELCPCPD